MIILKTTALTASLSGASVLPLPIVCSYIDLSDSTYSPTPNVTVTNGVTLVTVASAPDVNYTRQIKLLTIQNPNALTATITLFHGTTKLITATILAGGTLVYTDGRGFSTLDSSGQTLTAVAPSSFGAMILLKSGSGSDTAAAANTVDTTVISGLTVKDKLVIYVNGTDSAAGGVSPLLYHITDAATLATLSAESNNYYMDHVVLGCQSESATKMSALKNLFGTVTGTRVTLTTAWTGTWSLGLRHTGIGGGDTWSWAWEVYKLVGQ